MESFRHIILGVLSALLCLCYLSAAANTPVQDPRSLSIYQVVVGSFQHSDNSEAPGYSQMWGPDDHRKDGNIKGITESLDYIKALGANAIWLTPVFDSSNAFGGEKLQATGYFCNDYFRIDPHFGTLEEFREMIDEAHKRGIYVILDGVFGHCGGNVPPSPKGNELYGERGTDNVRGLRDGNIKFPESLPYMKELVRYWMDGYGVDGWRLDQCYQVYQDGHNYWNDLRKEVEAVAGERRARGEQWGTLGYMVGEDWGSSVEITTTQQNGLLSVFDFDARERLITLPNGVGSILMTYQSPTARGYEHDGVMPNLFLSNHDMTRVNDVVNDLDGLKLRFGVLAAYSGPVSLYYGDEFGDKSGKSQPDNQARTSGHLTTSDPAKQELHDYVAALFKARSENPALWRGCYSFREAPDLLEVTKTDDATGNKIVAVFATKDCKWKLAKGGIDLVSGEPVTAEISVKANIPRFIRPNTTDQ